MVFAPSFTSSLSRSLPTLQRTQPATGVLGRQLEGSRLCAPRSHQSHPPRGWHSCPPHPGLRSTGSGTRGSSWLRARIVPPGAGDRLGGSSENAFELRAAGGNEKKKKTNQHNKTLPKREGFKKLRKPPTVKHCTGLSQTVSSFAPVHPCGDPAQPRCGPNTPSLSPTTATLGTPPGQQLLGISICAFLKNAPNSNPDLGRLVCHRAR